MAYKGFKRALLSAATAGVLSAVAFPASGQEAVIAACQALPSEAARFSCLADALRLASGQASLTADDVAAAAVEPAAVVAAPAIAPQQAAPEPLPAATVATMASEPEPRGGLRLPFLGGRNDDAPATAGSDTVVAASLGAEQVATNETRPEATRVSARVVDSTLVGYKQLQVELDNGQIWRQVQHEEPWDDILNDEPDQVELWPSRFGGYRMLVVNAGLTMNVERVR
jgi:hypothetical protein